MSQNAARVCVHVLNSDFLWTQGNFPFLKLGILLHSDGQTVTNSYRLFCFLLWSVTENLKNSVCLQQTKIKYNVLMRNKLFTETSVDLSDCWVSFKYTFLILKAPKRHFIILLAPWQNICMAKLHLWYVGQTNSFTFQGFSKVNVSMCPNCLPAQRLSASSADLSFRAGGLCRSLTALIWSMNKNRNCKMLLWWRWTALMIHSAQEALQRDVFIWRLLISTGWLGRSAHRRLETTKGRGCECRPPVHPPLIRPRARGCRSNVCRRTCSYDTKGTVPAYPGTLWRLSQCVPRTGWWWGSLDPSWTSQSLWAWCAPWRWSVDCLKRENRR